MGDYPNLETPGGLIRSARLSRGMSVAELSSRTKIPVPVLEAIERDEYQKVSGALYIKSFLRSCAVEVGQDVEAVLGLYASFSGEGQGPSGGGVAPVWDEGAVEISRLGLPWPRLAAVGGALLLVVAAVLLFARGGADHEEAAGANVVETAVIKPALERVGEVAEDVAEEAPEEALQGDASPVPTAAAGDSLLGFADAKRFPVVLRLLVREPVTVGVRIDAENEFRSAEWAAPGTEATVLPERGIVMGRGYRVRSGLVVYWGANDHFSLRLARTTGVGVTLNGKPRRVKNLRPAGEMLLDALGE